ncbi:hypothetical protein HBI38_221060 [Parastagonospora nodorum]|nr:hypothetical protein HBI38_221060 [Parastagonospora nodorum]KAH6323697.1 hypothetical protein HBI37_224560 [Parastagonospora nodorum]KAH6336465.1 hypothetical protein HBI36_223970 [Parastagonospora nodorum]
MSASRHAMSSALVPKQAAPSAPAPRMPISDKHTVELPASKSSSSVIYTKSARVLVNVSAPDGKGALRRITVNITKTSPRRYQYTSWDAHQMAQDLVLLGILAIIAGGFWWLFYSDPTTYGPRVDVRGPRPRT